MLTELLGVPQKPYVLEHAPLDALLLDISKLKPDSVMPGTVDIWLRPKIGVNAA